MKTVMISGYYGFENAGDDAILWAMVQQFKEKINPIKIVVLSSNPQKTAQEYGVSSIDRGNFRKIYALLRDVDVFISGGGGLVQDVTGVPTVLYYLGLVFLAKMRHKKVMAYAQGFGPLQKKVSRLVAEKIMNLCDVITFRDEDSKKLAKEIGIKAPIYVTADPVFLLKPASSEEMRKILEKEKIEGKFKVGVSVRDWQGVDKVLSSLSSALQRLVEEYGAKIYVFPFQKSQDVEVSKKVLENVGKENCKIIPREYTIPQMLSLIGNMDFFVGMRLHSLIFSAIQGVPMVGLSYDPKVTSLMNHLECPFMHVEGADVEDLQEKVFGVIRNRQGFKEKILDKVKPLKVKAEENLKILKKLLYG